MADDIDIEEHDVMDNPIIKNMFPDLSVIKKEIQGYYDEDLTIKQEPGEAGIRKTSENILFNPETSFVQSSGGNYKTSQTNNSKWKSNNSEKSEKQVSQNTDNITTPVICSNKIILGSKPNEQVRQSKEKRLESVKVSVVLENINTTLIQSELFCNICLRLFPNTFVFDRHYEQIHSYLDRTDSTKYFKCDICDFVFIESTGLNLHYRNTHAVRLDSKSGEIGNNVFNYKQKLNSSNSSMTSKSHVCFHCKKLFETEKNLIEHLYHILQPKSASSNIYDEKNIIEISPDPENKHELENTVQVEKIKNSDLIQLEYDALYKCPTCSYYFKNDKFYDVHMFRKHNIKKHSKPKKVSFDPQCKFCPSKFYYMKSYNLHLQHFHKSKICFNKSKGVTKDMKLRKCNNFTKNKSIKAVNTFYKCVICCHYFKDFKFYMNHSLKMHKVSNNHGTQKVSFDSLCKHCSSSFLTVSSYNAHLSKCRKKHIKAQSSQKNKLGHDQSQYYSHNKQNKMKDITRNTYTEDTSELPNKLSKPKEQQHYQEKYDSNKLNIEDTLVLKSTIFKCYKCDVHFMSAKLAMNHSKHIEILVNWKCTECQRIFKRNEQLQHQKQHSVTNNFTVYNLSEIERSSVLYKCLKCAVHFAEDNFLLHYPMCGIEAPDSVYCKICDILVDIGSYKPHDHNHKHGNLNAIHFKIIEANVLMMGNKKRKYMKSSKKSNNTSKSKKLNFEEEYSPSKIFSFLDLFYCETCKCYLPYGYTHKVHLQSRCTHMVKYFCKCCGLQYTQKSIIAHKALHQRMPNLKLQDFRFYDIRNKLQIQPPLPEFYQCRICKIHFISKNSVKDHMCVESDHVKCTICQMKLTQPAHKLHMCFHEYSKTASTNLHNRVLAPNPETSDVVNLTDNKIITKEKIPSLASNKKFENLNLRNIQNTDELICKDVLETERKINVDSLGFSKIVFVNDVSSMECTGDIYEPEQLPNKIPEVSHSKNELTQLQEPVIVSEITQTERDCLEIVYLCKNCNIALDTYDKAVEHCQKHYSSSEELCPSKKCVMCELLFDPGCYDNHNHKHLQKGLNKSSFRILKFEIFYFTSNNSVWIKHVFGTLPDELVNKILNESIYSIERRIKLDVLQNGNNDLTVYKCGKCRIFVDPCNIYKHTTGCRSNIRKYPCSVCGLPFISAISKVQHEKIHKTPKIGLKSFRIAIFNDKETNYPDYKNHLHSQYILFQCRNCNGVVDKCKFSEHVCRKKYLKRCSHCGLLIYDKEYAAHIYKHKEFDSFVSENMKVILYGIKDVNDTEAEICSNNQLISSFIGIICDYTYYRCSKCEVCVKNREYISSHICPLPASKSKCLICDLFFPTTKLKYHKNLHENDPYFVKENLHVVPFNITENGKIQTNTYLKNPEIHAEMLNTKNITPDENEQKPNEPDNIIDKVALIYKCNCGLHFLTETSVYAHFDFCNPKLRISKQNCSKCDLLFTPKILFSHLITHHGNKKYNYTFDIVNVFKNKENKTFIYKCNKCHCHFVEKKDSEKHLITCNGSVEKVQECCGLKFDTLNYVAHQNMSHNNNDVEKQHTIIDLDESIFNASSSCLLDNKSKMLLDQVAIEADMVTDAKYNLSRESLLKIDVNNYTNKVYRCKDCGIHFLSKRAMQSHLNNFKNGTHTFFNNPQDICPICGLNFTLASLSRHIYVHHEKLNLKAEDVIIEDVSNED